MVKLFKKIKNVIDKEEYVGKDKLDFIDVFKGSNDDKKEDDNYAYPILRSIAISIARKNNTLKTDFCRNSNRKGITYLGFNKYSIDVIEIKNKTYWIFQVLDGEISWIEYQNKRETSCDGNFTEDDLKYLRCLIDVNNGEYIYYPNVDKYTKRTIKNSNYIMEYPEYYSMKDKFKKAFEEDSDE